MKAYLYLADGRTFSGEAFGYNSEAIGEVVFNTCMANYQEILTDPASEGQLVAMTYPLIGNYGINNEDSESGAFASGLIVREYSTAPCNFRSTTNLNDFMLQQKIVGITQIDTRALTRHIRTTGSQQALISTAVLSSADVTAKLKAYTFRSTYTSAAAILAASTITKSANNGETAPQHSAVVLDYGIKNSTMKLISELGYRITVMSGTSSASEVLKEQPDVIIACGGIDYTTNEQVINNLRTLSIANIPMLGICQGNLLLGMIAGFKVEKLKYGHHGQQPIRDYERNIVFESMQNHNHTLVKAQEKKVEILYQNVFDGTIEGFKMTDKPIMGVQFFPDYKSIAFKQFENLIANSKQKN